MKSVLNSRWAYRALRDLCHTKEQILSLNQLPRLDNITLFFNDDCIIEKSDEVHDGPWTCAMCIQVMKWLFFRLGSTSARLNSLTIENIPFLALNLPIMKMMRPVLQGLRVLRMHIMWPHDPYEERIEESVG